MSQKVEELLEVEEDAQRLLHFPGVESSMVRLPFIKSHFPRASVKLHGAGFTGQLQELWQLVRLIILNLHNGFIFRQSFLGAVKLQESGDVDTDEQEHLVAQMSLSIMLKLQIKEPLTLRERQLA